jgi:hypothetical protein
MVYVRHADFAHDGAPNWADQSVLPRRTASVASWKSPVDTRVDRESARCLEALDPPRPFRRERATESAGDDGASRGLPEQ